MNETFEQIADELRATRLMEGSRVEVTDDGVVANDTHEIAQGFLLRVAEKYDVSVCEVGDTFFFHKMPYAKACNYVSCLVR